MNVCNECQFNVEKTNTAVLIICMITLLLFISRQPGDSVMQQEPQVNKKAFNKGLECSADTVIWPMFSLKIVKVDRS